MPSSTDRPAWERQKREDAWINSDDPRRVNWGWFAHGVGLLVSAIIVIVAITVGLWAFGLATSGAKGAGDVVRKNNDANNRINSQAYFENLWGDIQGYTAKLPVAAQAMTDGSDPNAAINYRGLYNTCVDAVNQYNAASQQTLFKDWKTADLPQRVDVTQACPLSPLPSTSH